LGFGLLRQRDAARAGEREAWRGCVDLAAQFLAAENERAGDLADAFFGDEQIVYAELHVVARLLERPAPAGGIFDEPRERGARILERRDLLDRKPPPVGVERIGRIPSNECRARHRTAALVDRHAIQTYAGAVEPQRGL